MGMDKDIVTNGYIYYVYIKDSEFCFAAFQLRYVVRLDNKVTDSRNSLFH